MMKAGLTITILLFVAGCASATADAPRQLQQSDSLEQSRNEQLKIEARALREAVRQQRNELQSLSTSSQ